MALITYPNKNTGDQFTAAEATEIKTVVNANHEGVMAAIDDAVNDAFALKISVANSVWNEIPTGAINGSNLVYTIANTPVSNCYLVVVDSAVLSPTTHYTISGTTLTIIGIAPVSQVLIFYLK